MQRRTFIKASCAASLATMLPRWSQGQPSASGKLPTGERPNIIYMVCHDLGKHISPYGVPIQTPNFQALSDSGILFQNAFCSTPCCMPSRCSAMTGKHAHHNGNIGTNHGWQLAKEQLTIVDYLNEGGYETVHAGFQHERPRREDNRYQKLLHKTHTDLDYFCENVVDQGIEFLEERKKQSDTTPFYLNMGFVETHSSQFLPTTNPNSWNVRFGRPQTYGIDPLDEVYVPPSMPDNERTREMFRRFQPCIRFLDHHLGRFMETVDRLGYNEDTVICFVTDHGYFGARHKSTIYEGGMEITAMMRWDNHIKPNTDLNGLISNIDFTPTLLEIARVPVPEEIDGKSFLPVLLGEQTKTQDAIFTQRNHHGNYDPVRSIRTKDFHYIRNFHPQAKHLYTVSETMAMSTPDREGWPNSPIMGGASHFDLPKYGDWPARAKEELYDIRRDPDEQHNIADDPAYTGIKATLAVQLEEEMMRTNDPVLYDPYALDDISKRA